MLAIPIQKLAAVLVDIQTVISLKKVGAFLSFYSPCMDFNLLFISGTIFWLRHLTVINR